jgi:hypothetical protein
MQGGKGWTDLDMMSNCPRGIPIRYAARDRLSTTIRMTERLAKEPNEERLGRGFRNEAWESYLGTTMRGIPISYAARDSLSITIRIKT